tara:strand:+ start:230 stop:439 length:210 start_codon:yes stop_codon:yes gene_type:complete
MDAFRIALDTKRRHGYNYQNGQWIRGFQHNGTADDEIRWMKWQRLEKALRTIDENTSYEDIIKKVMGGE